MKVETVKKPKSVIEITISAEEADIKQFRDVAISKLAKDKPPKGFRPGKADEAALRRALGDEAVEKAIMDEVLPSLYLTAIQQEKINPVARAEADIVSKAPLLVKFTVEVLPELTIGNYAKIKLKPTKLAVQEKEVTEALANIRKHLAKRKIVTRPAQKSDYLEIDFVGTVAGKELDMLKSKNHPVEVGAGFLLPDFEKQLLGMKEGEEKEIKVEFPQADLAGKEASFKVKVNKVEEPELPELNDELAQQISGGRIKTLLELQEEIKKDMLQQKESNLKNQQEAEVIKQLDKLIKTELPEGLVHEEIEHIFALFSNNLEARGTNMGTYCLQQKTSAAKIKEGFKEEAERRIRIRLALLQVAKEAKIEVTPAELAAALTDEEKKDTRSKAIKETELVLKKTLAYLQQSALK